MKQIAQIHQIFPDGTAEVIRLPEESCSGNCAVCGGCEPQTPFLVRNDIGAQVGDRVVLEPDAKVSRKVAAMLCTVPTGLLLAGYLLGEHFWGRGALMGLAGAVAGLWLVLQQDRKMTRKNPITYVITGMHTDEAA